MSNRILNAVVSVAMLAGLVVGLVLIVPALTRHWREPQPKSDPTPASKEAPRGRLGELNTVMDASGDLDSMGSAGGSGSAVTPSEGTTTNQRPATTVQPQKVVRTGPAKPRPAPLTLKQRARRLGQSPQDENNR